jgi:hypothetical protein
MTSEEQPPVMKLPVNQRTNRVHWFTGRVHQVLDDALAGGVRLVELSATETADALIELARLEARLAGIKLHLVAHADEVDVAQENASTSTAAWLTSATRLPRTEAKKLVKAAGRLEAFEATAAATIEGAVDGAQAGVIIRRVDALPPQVGPEDRRRAEAHLLELAGQFDAVTLDRLARHLHHVIDPDGAEKALAAQVAKEEAAAAAKTSLHLYDDGHGSCHGQFTIPSVHGDMLRVALDALASPKRPDPILREVEENGQPTTRPIQEIHGEAFTQLLERFPTKKLPTTGGGLATVLVTIPLGLLEEGLGVATLSTGGTISAGSARRLACTAGLIPQVLDSKSVILDQGRRVRLHTTAQRIAMASRDKSCTATGCTMPAAFCHAHHKKPWAKGGRTSVQDGTMLCPRHHRMVHDPRYTTDYTADGKTHITRTSRRRT